jgi:hypothetical protein
MTSSYYKRFVQFNATKRTFEHLANKQIYEKNFIINLSDIDFLQQI